MHFLVKANDQGQRFVAAGDVSKGARPPNPLHRFVRQSRAGGRTGMLANDGMFTCRGINLTDAAANTLVKLQSDDENSGVWLENEQTGHVLFLSANNSYTGIGVNGKCDRTKTVFSLAVKADGTLLTPEQSHSAFEGTQREQPAQETLP